MDPDGPDPFPELSPDEARHVDAVCRAFEAAWSAGQRARLEDRLPPGPGPLRDALALELIALERELRRAAGEHPTPSEYLNRFPDLATAIGRAFTERPATQPSASAAPAPREARANRETVFQAPPRGAPAAGPAVAPPPAVRRRETPRDFGGYVIFAEIAHGGMGGWSTAPDTWP